jgi:hypothetical protein
VCCITHGGVRVCTTCPDSHIASRSKSPLLSFFRSSNHPDLGAPSLASETWDTQRSVGASVHRHEVPVTGPLRWGDFGAPSCMSAHNRISRPKNLLLPLKELRPAARAPSRFGAGAFIASSTKLSIHCHRELRRHSLLSAPSRSQFAPNPFPYYRSGSSPTSPSRQFGPPAIRFIIFPGESLHGGA